MQMATLIHSSEIYILNNYHFKKNTDRYVTSTSTTKHNLYTLKPRNNYDFVIKSKEVEIDFKISIHQNESRYIHHNCTKLIYMVLKRSERFMNILECFNKCQSP